VANPQRPMANTMSRKTPVKWPPKVPDGFPMNVTARGYVKTIGGKTRWICGKKSPAEALRIMYAKATRIAAKSPVLAPAPTGHVVSVHTLLGKWINAREADLHAGKLKPATFAQYRRSAKRIDAVIGTFKVDEYMPETTEQLHRELSTRHGADFGRRAVGHWRDCCLYAEERRWCRPVALGRKIVRSILSRPAARVKWTLMDKGQIKTLLAAAKAATEGRRNDFRQQAEQFHAALLLALNGGYGPTELAEMPKSFVDVEKGVVKGLRGKTGVNHVCPLWPETLEALKLVLVQRPDDVLLFRTRNGNQWVETRAVMEAGHAVNSTGHDNFKERWNELTRPLGLKVEGQGFYKLRHCHATAADKFGDDKARRVLMGHAMEGSTGHYVEVGEDRLRKLVEFIRQELIL
jgi:integrase